jgi:hypothetical protein
VSCGTERPCYDYRPWVGQEPLCGNCGWPKTDHGKGGFVQTEGPVTAEGDPPKYVRRQVKLTPVFKRR